MDERDRIGELTRVASLADPCRCFSVPRPARLCPPTSTAAHGR
jgi:hypothetical protein